MKISDKIKIMFNLKKFTFEDLTLLKQYVDKEFQVRLKTIKKIKNN